MYSDHFKKEFEQNKESSERSTSHEKTVTNPYLKEIRRKKQWKEKIESNKALPKKFFQQAKRRNLKHSNPDLWEQRQLDKALRMEEERSDIENSKFMDLEESLIKKDIGNEYMHQCRVSGKEHINSLEYQLKRETGNIKEFGQVVTLKMKIGKLDTNADQLYSKAKFSANKKEKLEGNQAADEIVIQSMFNKLYLIENLKVGKEESKHRIKHRVKSESTLANIQGGRFDSGLAGGMRANEDTDMKKMFQELEQSKLSAKPVPQVEPVQPAIFVQDKEDNF